MPKREWEPVVTYGVGQKNLLAAKPLTAGPLMMRARNDCGQWVFREPTKEEVDDYLESEAW